MKALAAIRGTFSDFKLIKTRKLAQLIIEIPIEQADAALTALGGLPRSDAERWCAIALLDPTIRGTVDALREVTKKHSIKFDADEIAALRQEEPKERRAFCELPFPQQAGIKSADVHFQLWLSNHNACFAEEPDCAAAIRRHCRVKSRADILPGTDAGERWLALLREYEGVR